MKNDLQIDDDKVISILLEGAKFYDQQIDYKYWEEYKELWIKINFQLNDQLSLSTPMEILYSFFEGYRINKWSKEDKEHTEQELKIKSMKFTTNGLPFVSWYKTKMYYRLEPMLEEILSGQGDRAYNNAKGKELDIPANIFENLPSKSFFIKTSYDAFGVNDNQYIITFGVFVTYEDDIHSDGHYLSIFVAMGEAETGAIHSIPIFLYIPSDKNVTIGECIERLSSGFNLVAEDKIFMKKVAVRAVQYVLYLCCDKADVVLLKKGSLSICTNIRHRYGEVTQYIIGKNLAELFKFQSDGTPKYFLRNCCWKRVHHGKRGSKEEKVILTWIAPTVVENWDRSSNKKHISYAEIDVELKLAEQREDAELSFEIENETFDEKYVDLEEPINVDSKYRIHLGDGKYFYKRNRTIAKAALRRAGYKCEICTTHKTFIRKNTRIPYTEPHHLIPMAYQDDFQYSIDRVNNIVSLCSNCHNEIHYGINSSKLIEILFEKRECELKRIGVEITLNELKDMY